MANERVLFDVNKTKHNIIVIAGRRGSGKDTAADYLVEKHGYTRISFADIPKRAVSVMFGWPMEMLDGKTAESRFEREQVDEWWSKELDQEVIPVEMLKYFATELVRDNLNQRMWVLALKRLITRTPEVKFVISDGRFFEDLELIKELGGARFGIYRKIPEWLEDFYQQVDAESRAHIGKSFMELDYSDRTDRNIRRMREFGSTFMTQANLSLQEHRSEWEMLLYNDYDGIIDNTSTLEHLHSQLDTIARDLDTKWMFS